MSVDTKLSKEQQKIVNFKEGAICVRASAGSGKTRVLTERIRCLLDKTKKKVLALTFTNKASEEIRERLGDIPNLGRRVFIGTFHGFCQKILENHGHLIGLSKMPHIFENRRDCLELIRQALKLTPSYASYNGELSEVASRALEFISKRKRELVEFDSKKDLEKNEDLILLYENYQDILSTQNAMDFDDLLLYTYQLLTDFPDIANLYRRSFFAICVDEAQDLNNAQYQLLLALVGDEFNNVMLVGDPNQSIFHFAGASSEYMNNYFIESFNAKIIELNENYRSSRRILNVTKKIFPESQDIPNVVKEGIFEINGLDDENDEAHWVINKINELISMKKHNDIEGGITYEKMAILARNKYILASVEKSLKNANLSYYYKVTPGAIEFESKLMRLFYIALKVHLNPLDKLHKKQLFKQMGRNQSNMEMDWDKIVQTTGSDQDRIILELITRLHYDGSNFKALVGDLKNTLDIDDDNEKNMLFNDIDELIENWINYAKKTDKKSIRHFKNSMALGQTHPLMQHKGVTLSTVHTMKGQEFDIVFLIGMDEGTFPDYRAINKGGIEMTQERNNLYVAFTRSRRFLYLTWPQKRKMRWGGHKNRRISQFLAPLRGDEL